MEQDKFSINKTRRDESVPYDSIWIPPSKTSAYFFKEHGNRVKKQMVQWFTDHFGKIEALWSNFYPSKF